MSKFVYQIYPLSFKDSDGKGTGDIKGIISKIDYIKSLGVDYIWLTPVFKTLFKDNGYDIVDYYNVDPKFGTNKDLENLIHIAKEKKLGVMLDMVFNHTSTDCEWFKKWINGDEEYKDFYISKYSEGKAPTNWVSKFGGSAWKEYKPNNWYLHLFDETQADLNWENPKVREKLKDVVRHYIKLGVKGFRFDVINLISKGQYLDDYEGDGRKFYTDGPRVHEFIQEISKEFPNEAEFLTVGELSSTSIENTIKYANKERTELHSAFTFHHLKVDYDGLDKFIDKKPDIKKLNDIFALWSTSINAAGSTMANFFNNHDQPRSISRFVDQNYWKEGAKMLFALTSSMPGITYLFQGEEIGMTNPGFNKPEEYKDVETLNYFKAKKLSIASEGIKQKSRDNSRTPVQWNSDKNAGFTTGTPWIGIPENYKFINVEAEEKDGTSILHFYREFIQFAKQNTIFEKGTIKWLPYKENLLSFEREFDGRKLRFYFSFANKDLLLEFNKNKVIKSNCAVFENKLQPYQFIIEEI